MKLLLTALFTLLFFGCDAKTITTDALIGGTSQAIVTVLDCKATAVVYDDVKKEIDSWFSTQQKEGKTQESIGSSLCQLAISSVVPSLLGTTFSTIKPQWECKLTKLEDAAKLISNTVCSSL